MPIVSVMFGRGLRLRRGRARWLLMRIRIGCTAVISKRLVVSLRTCGAQPRAILHDKSAKGFLTHGRLTFERSKGNVYRNRLGCEIANVAGEGSAAISSL